MSSKALSVRSLLRIRALGSGATVVEPARTGTAAPAPGAPPPMGEEPPALPPDNVGRAALRSKNFLAVTAADFIARAAYQMGKTPLLPIFAASLGATDVLLGLIVSVSTVTGMLLKPFIGMLSDRAGRRNWLLIGTCFFAFMPFVYQFIITPQQLFVVRIIHGMATAIYGPVTLAYVTEQAGAARAEGLGWFGIARSGGYIVGPALAGWLLLYLTPQQVFTIIGVMSCMVFVPVFMLSDAPKAKGTVRKPFSRDALDAFAAGMQTPAIWLGGSLDALTYVALYAMKAFLPVYTLSIGVNVALIGVFFALQEGVVAVAKPVGGRIGDRFGYRTTIGVGMALIGLALPLLTVSPNGFVLLLLSVALGVGQALIFPSTTALVAVQIDQHHTGAGMGFLGTLDNGGKVLGPLVGGALVALFGYEAMFATIGGFTVFFGGTLLLGARRRRTSDVG